MGVVRSIGAKLVNGSGVFCSEYYMKMLGYFPDDTAEGWDPAGNPAALTSRSEAFHIRVLTLEGGLSGCPW